MVRTLFDRLFPLDRASRIAILYEHREITYSELCAETIRVAEVLNGLDIQGGVSARYGKAYGVGAGIDGRDVNRVGHRRSYRQR